MEFTASTRTELWMQASAMVQVYKGTEWVDSRPSWRCNPTARCWPVGSSLNDLTPTEPRILVLRHNFLRPSHAGSPRSPFKQMEKSWSVDWVEESSVSIRMAGWMQASIWLPASAKRWNPT